MECFLRPSAASCSAVDRPLVSVTVKLDGKSCVVRNHNANCAALPGLLTQELGFDREVLLSASSEGCGEPARDRAIVVAGKLKAAGFSHIAVVGFITEPNTNCEKGGILGE